MKSTEHKWTRISKFSRDGPIITSLSLENGTEPPKLDEVFNMPINHHPTNITILINLVFNSYKRAGCKFPDDVVTSKVPFGGFLLFNNMTPHRRYKHLLNLKKLLNNSKLIPNRKFEFTKREVGFLFDTAETGTYLW